MSENDERAPGVLDPNNPIDQMMPPADNPEYHRKLKEHRDAQHQAAEAAVLSDPTHAALGDRLTPVRQSVPQAAAPQPLPPTDVPPVAPPATPKEYTGLTVDPTLAQVDYTPVEPRLPEGAQPQTQAAPVSVAAPAPVPVAPVPPQPVDPPPSIVITETLSKLREDFGIDKIPLTEVVLNGHTFALRVLDTASVSTAIRFADTLSMTDRENAINLQIALVSMSVMSIDGEPLYKVFDIDIPQDQLIMVEGVKKVSFPPLNPPASIRTTAATQFMEFLNTTASTSLLGALWDAYNADVDPKGTLKQLMSVVNSAGEGVEEIPLP